MNTTTLAEQILGAVDDAVRLVAPGTRPNIERNEPPEGRQRAFEEIRTRAMTGGCHNWRNSSFLGILAKASARPPITQSGLVKLKELQTRWRSAQDLIQTKFNFRTADNALSIGKSAELLATQTPAQIAESNLPAQEFLRLQIVGKMKALKLIASQAAADAAQLFREENTFEILALAALESAEVLEGQEKETFKTYSLEKFFVPSIVVLTLRNSASGLRTLAKTATGQPMEILPGIAVWGVKR